ncbi:uncharacterized protein LOC123032296 [Varanus komodoensis]|uniref:uncharacterized protein LOC123032296 n=1 Tax=Varanus komodoensis TaxID=61221 RepID=UPI001CF7EAD1|nr:uncharacterized protein LOC123032296 [Varanus komodoensis]
MAAVIASVARLLQPALAISEGESGCHGLAPWYLLLGLRLVALFIADGPWSSTKPDLACNWTSTTVETQSFCRALCFNQHFSSSTSSVWGFAFLIVLLPVGLMRLIRAGATRKGRATRKTDEELTDTMGASPNMASGINMAPGTLPLPSIAAFRNNTLPLESKFPCCTRQLVAFNLCVILLLTVEACFLWIVVSLQIPSVSEMSFLCLPRAQSCPQALECVVAGQADKQVALWALVFTAIVNVGASLAYLFLQLGKVPQCRGR